MKYFWIFLLSVPNFLFAQSSNIPLNHDYYHWIDRYEVKAGKVSSNLFTTVKPYKRSDVLAFLDSLKKDGVFSSTPDQFNLEFFHTGSWEFSNGEESNSKKPFLKTFFKKKADFFHVQEEAFDLHVNPVLYWGLGRDGHLGESYFVNTRGVEIRGMIDKKVGFYSFLSDNQARLPSYVQDPLQWRNLLPHEGFWKPFKGSGGVDYLHARGHISFQATRHINFQMGHDRFFIGNGYRSLVFSDFGPPALYFKTTAKVWKLNYQSSLHQMVADPSSRWISNGGYPVKFLAFHHLSVNLGKKFNLGLFESVIFSPDDSTGAQHFELAYLNPIIFYRAVEHQNGSTDNVLLGLDFKWNAIKKVSLYGQFLLDEFLFDHVKAGDGWWANKFGLQGGIKYMDAFSLSNLDLQVEGNVVRPYTYSHYTDFGNYTHYNQPIAHPLGANFKEFIAIVRYQPLPRLNLTGKWFSIQAGRDTLNSVKGWGGNIMKVNSFRYNELGNTIGQGIENRITMGSFIASYQWKYGLFIDLEVSYRNSESKISYYQRKSFFTNLALRWNIPSQRYEY